MASRLELQTKLEELLGSRNVYYQPPETITMNYPAVVYNKSKIKASRADNALYLKDTSYDITVISNKPDNEVILKILGLPLCIYDRHFKSDNLYHDVLTLYF